MSTDALLAEIEARLGFVPPFFTPAVGQPEVLTSLWRQTEAGYLDNPLPALFKEKLAALLGRYCEVPYCLLCHSCSLRPLGMTGPSILGFLTQPHPADEQILAAVQRLQEADGELALRDAPEVVEQDVFVLSSAIYFSTRLAAVARSTLRRRLSPSDYANLVLFISYNRTCHEWMAAHPEVSYELDQRYQKNFSPMVAEEPSLAVLFASSEVRASVEAAPVEETVSARIGEAREVLRMSEQRFLDVLGAMNSKGPTAGSRGAERDALEEELRLSAAFAEELLAVVSHDLRNPLNTILVASNVILRLTSGNQTVAKPAQQIIRATNRAARMVHELLDFSLARAGGGIPVQLGEHDLDALVRGVVDDMRGLHPDRSFQLRGELAGAGAWDADRITQVLTNLLANAVSHGRPDAPIVVTTAGDEDTVTLTIHNDNQHGPIPPDLLPMIFTPFKRGVRSAVSATRSIGLGLYIVREIVRAHRGEVTASSGDDGTTFTVRLPRSATSRPIAG